ncbi:hypothetical protein DICPUDRAFT_96443 [Dictyostelium purpureum]|uniref:Biogenesis of lysosome-related organelles complex 1 subunit 3 n=1 Tax=Dictyostelium purpureum TaxID=5786 RepID=F0Z8B5_DICPU|nr:uncharacterized protein DICPUDRAFT_96443 [Dictyostelium purpureum]EGC39788.1 hypothetical protein DICPUDRAFT_96443 [Dictyostelium purpureum]|eukprot:XP_003283655.1 hypothetical protein DICPUDRAFT_96443 [Dictyostelium purpureum]
MNNSFILSKNKKIVEGEEDEEEEEIYDEEYDIKPVAILPKSSSNLNINKEISINDHPEDLVVGANSPLEINNSTKTENPEIPLDLDSNSGNKNNSNNTNNSNNNNTKKDTNSLENQSNENTTDLKKSTGDTPNNTTTTTTTTTAAAKEEFSPIQVVSPLSSPASSLSSSILSQSLNEHLQSTVAPQRKLSASQQPQRIPLSLGENKLREYNETLRKSFCSRSHNLYFSINREVTNANQHLSSVLEVVKSIQHNIRQSNDDILILSEKLEQTEWSLQC